MSRIEPLNTWFFPIPSLWVNGEIIPAPKEAIEEYCKLRDSWLKQQPINLHEIPSVELYPGRREEQDGYFVRTKIMYR